MQHFMRSSYRLADFCSSGVSTQYSSISIAYSQHLNRGTFLSIHQRAICTADLVLFSYLPRRTALLSFFANSIIFGRMRATLQFRSICTDKHCASSTIKSNGQRKHFSMHLFYTVISRLSNYKNRDHNILKKGLQI
jgi:hypothetical protein